ncbi:MAG: hypothetical protein V3T00_09785 [bacterium]
MLEVERTAPGSDAYGLEQTVQPVYPFDRVERWNEYVFPMTEIAELLEFGFIYLTPGSKDLEVFALGYTGNPVLVVIGRDVLFPGTEFIIPPERQIMGDDPVTARAFRGTDLLSPAVTLGHPPQGFGPPFLMPLSLKVGAKLMLVTAAVNTSITVAFYWRERPGVPTDSG